MTELKLQITIYTRRLILKNPFYLQETEVGNLKEETSAYFSIHSQYLRSRQATKCAIYINIPLHNLNKRTNPRLEDSQSDHYSFLVGTPICSRPPLIKKTLNCTAPFARPPRLHPE